MSTFNGIITEFPEIRVDYFRTISGRTPPLAGFLSHVHSDHLQGLESLKAPFVYCSAATRELLLRLEKYPHRLNFSKGILESSKQTYKHLRKILKPLPLQTPTDLELGPNRWLRVTLFDANHCAGAVMFLFQDKEQAVLYTGDIRSEDWWVNALVRHPVLLPYTLGPKRLNNVYLDTTFAVKSVPFRQFLPKCDGIRELLEKVSQHPEDTVFHFNSWTFGYEDVWIALSSALGCPIHVDEYKYKLYASLSSTDSSNGFLPAEGPALFGFMCGNRFHPGCLTRDPNTRLHTCERGMQCPVILNGTNVVQIVPIVNRLSSGLEVLEQGFGGGQGDLRQTHELELYDAETVDMLMDVCLKNIQDDSSTSKISTLLSGAATSSKHTLSLDTIDWDSEDEIPLSDLAKSLEKMAQTRDERHGSDEQYIKRVTEVRSGTDSLAKRITFPYSRHSSYEELCLLLDALRPLDIYPCTVDEENWETSLSMRALFEHLCSGDVFAHDREMLELEDSRAESRKRKLDMLTSDPDFPSSDRRESSQVTQDPDPAEYQELPSEESLLPSLYGSRGELPATESVKELTPVVGESREVSHLDSQSSELSAPGSDVPEDRRRRRREVYDAVRRHGSAGWLDFRPVTVGNRHTEPEFQL